MTSFRFAFSVAAAALLLAISPAAARTPVPPQPLGNPGEWIGTSDYPSGALRRQSEGATSFRVTVGIDGRVSACQITVSSGWAVLDEATCRLISERARFSSASDRKGRPVIGYYQNRVRWMIPEDKRNPLPGVLVTSALIAPDGTVSDCRVERAEGDAVKQMPVGSMRRCTFQNLSQGYVDAAGKPVYKRLRVNFTIEVLDAEAPVEPAPAAAYGQAGAAPARP
mgnify:CR=1 FL=1